MLLACRNNGALSLFSTTRSANHDLDGFPNGDPYELIL